MIKVKKYDCNKCLFVKNAATNTHTTNMALTRVYHLLLNTRAMNKNTNNMNIVSAFVTRFEKQTFGNSVVIVTCVNTHAYGIQIKNSHSSIGK